jgi:hypothetical protein
MFHKLIFVLAATAAIGATALVPTAAAAKGWHRHHFRHHWVVGFYGPGFYGPGFYRAAFYGPGFIVGPNCYLADRVVRTRFGKRVRTVEVCT